MVGLFTGFMVTKFRGKFEVLKIERDKYIPLYYEVDIFSFGVAHKLGCNV